MRKKLKTCITTCVTLLMVSSMVADLVVSAEENYNVYNYDKWSEATPSQTGYEADRSVSGSDLGVGDFDSPSDLFRDYQDLFYVVDTGNDRIVVTDSEFTEAVDVLDTFTYEDGSTTTLKDPEGIFVSEDTGYIYIADTGNARCLITDMDCNVVMELTRPDSTMYENETFDPEKVVVDNAGNIYIVLNNITTGAAYFDATGEFQGYFGANTVEATAEVIADYFWNLIATDEMRANSSRNVAAGITNFDIDDEGFVYTVTQSSSTESDRVKKVNPAGYNLYSSWDVTFGDLESEYSSSSSEDFTTQMVDIDVDDVGRLNCLDLESGRVFQYDEDGNLLFIFGSISEQLGGFSLKVTAVESMGSNVYVADSLKNTITIFVETEFGEIVHEAVSLYNEGYYEEALEPWEEVLQRDGNYQMAYVGIASALYNQGDYEGSMEYAELAESSDQYNKAFEGYRQEWLEEYGVWLIVALVVLIIIYLIYRYRRKKKLENAPKNLVDMLYEDRKKEEE